MGRRTLPFAGPWVAELYSLQATWPQNFIVCRPMGRRTLLFAGPTVADIGNFLQAVKSRRS